MSKTDKTRPWRVKMREHPSEVHDHRNGVCELLADPTRTRTAGRREECYVEAQWWRPEFHCGCALCRGWTDERRKVRREGKQQARDFA